MKVLVTGASGNGGQAVCRELLRAGHQVRMADVMPSHAADLAEAEFVRCDTRTVTDVRQAVQGMDGVIHLAAWHCAHQPPVSDDTIFAVNVDGTYNVLEACRQEGIRSIVYASSMAYGWWSVYGVSKVIGEDLCRTYHEMTGASIAMLRYHEFIPRPYLEFGERLLRNGVDRRDVATATVQALEAAGKQSFGLFRTIVHTDHGMPEHVRADFAGLGLGWCEEQVPGSAALLAKYGIELPKEVEQHDLSEAKRVLGWEPRTGFVDFLRDLKRRDEEGLDIHALIVPSELPRTQLLL
ncbi:NAD-dependent epimerase/dehydratase family protein [Paenibacillus sacheonensis]|uniref:SDR family NAD(P)-dependent oxidoreductase n=1 Tax=Paenibacillus sacheonensis TaxID=742054 RepID=A0A7X4YT25_9BACL|nr:NAD(P)-dependent oxidoreductase [Paenibacillus sacheonensis]MBM7567672.1 nucleoside-diphosphate-sugar epimerase [Paenibacillus sacheonensis]NBC72052.1 SDR family NAD(P)-dependent oxidoreductase [Paenibacillus sacheonensis]